MSPPPRSPLPRLLGMVAGRRLRRQRVRVLLTVAGVALGVGVVTAIEIANQSARDSIDRLVAGVSAAADLQVRGSGDGLAVDLLPRVAADPDVAGVWPVVEAPTRRSGGGPPLLAVGIDATRESERREWQVTGGDPLRLLTDPDHLLVAAPLARQERLTPGDTLTLTTACGSVPFRVEGIVTGEGIERVLGGRTVWLDVAAAAAWFGDPDAVSHFDVALHPGADRLAVAARLEGIAPGTRVVTPEGRARGMREVIAAFQANLRVVSLVALFVGTFLVLNTMITAVVQQRRELGLLKALGLERRRLLALVAVEAGLIGLAGSLLGAVGGLALGRWTVQLTTATLSRVYVLVDAAHTLVPWWVPAGAVGLGVVTSVGAALLPGFEAARIPPAQTVRQPPLMAGGASRAGRLALAALPVAGLVVLLSRPGTAGELPLLGYVAGLLVLVVATLLAPGLTMAAGHLLRRPAGRLGGVMARLGTDNLGRQAGRSALAVSALASGLALTVCVGAMIGSFKGSITDWVDASINSDLVITSGARYTGPANVPFPAAFGDSLAALPGVRLVNSFRMVEAEAAGRPFALAVLDLDDWMRENPLRFLSGGPATDPGPAAVIVSDNFRQRFGLDAGDELDLATPNGPLKVRILGAILDFTADRGALFLDSATYRRWWGDERVDTWDLYLQTGVAAADVQQTIEARWGTERDLFIMRHDELRMRILEDVDATFAVVYAMQVIAAMIALLGVVTTLAAAVTDRRRELAVLRAVGTTRRQLGRAVVTEAALLGGVGGLLGLAAGTALSGVLIYVIQYGSTGWLFPYRFPWFLGAVVLIGSVAASALAARYPARLAGAVDLAAALEYE